MSPAKRKAPYEIQKILVLSTCHITESDNDFLRETTFCQDDPADSGITPFEYGYRIYVGTDREIANETIERWKNITGLSQALVNLLCLTRRLKCVALVLDCDGQERDDLPKFNW